MSYLDQIWSKQRLAQHEWSRLSGKMNSGGGNNAAAWAEERNRSETGQKHSAPNKSERGNDFLHQEPVTTEGPSLHARSHAEERPDSRWRTKARGKSKTAEQTERNKNASRPKKMTTEESKLAAKIKNPNQAAPNPCAVNTVVAKPKSCACN
jgi:hypothetical protein